jgi:hypothetical protein
VRLLLSLGRTSINRCSATRFGSLATALPRVWRFLQIIEAVRDFYPAAIARFIEFQPAAAHLKISILLFVCHGPSSVACLVDVVYPCFAFEQKGKRLT